MKLINYHFEILNLLDERYPKSLRKSSLLALLSDKNPDKFEREIKYLEEHWLLEKRETTVEVFGISFPIITGFKISAKGMGSAYQITPTSPFLKLNI